MRRSRRTVAASVSVSMALATSVAVAHADDTSSSALYVNNATAAHCSNTASGAGSATTPFCTIQAAANAAVPGDTVDIAAGSYVGADITSAGTAQAPIVFQATGGTVSITNAGGAAAGPGLSFDGASYVTFEGSEGAGIQWSQRLLVYGALVNGSSHITLDSIRTSGPGDGVHVTGTSSDVAITRSILLGVTGNVVVDAGSSGDVVSTNEIEVQKIGVSVEGSTGTAITSNSLIDEATSGTPIRVTGDATGTSIENNIVVGPTSSTGAAVSADSTSTAGTTVDYNVVWPYGEGAGGGTESAYSWAGVDYATQSSFTAATGQGRHDLVADPQFDVWPFTNSAVAPQLNSANAGAPGMVQTDLYGTPCTDDPIVAVTGAGSPDYCARGAVQQTYSTTVSASATPTTALSVDLSGSVSETSGEAGPILAAPTPGIAYVINWGDGTTSAPTPGADGAIETDASHTYAKAGTYTITDTAELSDGTTTSTTTSVTTTGSDYTPFGPTRILDTRNGTGAAKAKVAVGHSITVKVSGVDGIPADATAVALNLTVTDGTGNGYLSVGNTAVSNLNYAAGQTVANSVIAPVVSGSITVYNSGTGGSADTIADVSGYFARSGGEGFAVTTPARFLDTRNGTGAPEAKVAANSAIPVTIAGADSIPSGVGAVAVHVTVVDTTGNGWIAAEPDSGGTPGTSSLNYGKGQIVSNTVIVPVAADGKIELYNGGGTTPVDLVADVSGYFSTGVNGAYMPITAFRASDYQTSGLLNPNSPFGKFLDEIPSGSDTSVFPANATMVINLTTTQETSNGYITGYPDGTTPPNTSSLDFGPGQTVANLSIVGSTGPYQIVDFYNHSSGYTGLDVDVQGYFTNS